MKHTTIVKTDIFLLIGAEKKDKMSKAIWKRHAPHKSVG